MRSPLTIRFALWRRRWRRAKLRRRYPDFGPAALRSMAYILERGRRLTASTLPDRLLREWLIRDPFDVCYEQMMRCVAAGTLHTCTPFVVLCFLCWRHARRRCVPFIRLRDIRPGRALRNPDCALGLLFWEMQQLLAVVARCRELGIDLPTYRSETPTTTAGTSTGCWRSTARQRATTPTACSVPGQLRRRIGHQPAPSALHKKQRGHAPDGAPRRTASERP